MNIIVALLTLLIAAVNAQTADADVESSATGNPCEYGDVAIYDGIGYVFKDEDFHPVCLHWFQNNHYGADHMCQMLGFESASANPVADGNYDTSEHTPFFVGDCWFELNEDFANWPNCMTVYDNSYDDSWCDDGWWIPVSFGCTDVDGVDHDDVNMASCDVPNEDIHAGEEDSSSSMSGIILTTFKFSPLFARLLFSFHCKHRA